MHINRVASQQCMHSSGIYIIYNIQKNCPHCVYDYVGSLHSPVIPSTGMVAELQDGLLFSTVQVYSPSVITVRVCVYCAVSGSSNTVLVPSVIMVESLVQVTVVAGPPVEIQVRVSWSESKITLSPNMVMLPTLIAKCMRERNFIIIIT